jgi:hypothetical protein
MSSYPAEFDPVPIQVPIQKPSSVPVAPPAPVLSSSQQQPSQSSYQPSQSSLSNSSSVSIPQKQYKYFPAPPVITTYHQYQDVNNDAYLQEKETFYFLDKTLEWIKHDKSFKKLKKYERYLKGPDGYTIIHKLLKLFVRRGNTNWYDLKMQQSLVKDYIKHKLSKY